MLLRFEVHQFCMKGTHYLLLPKLNPAQMRVMAERLGRLGEPVESDGQLTARLREGVVHVDPRGLCWARFDPSDAILPAMPEVLSCPKVKVPSDVIRAMYYRESGTGRARSIRLSLRLESGPSWKALRALGDSALAPDEHEVAVSLFRDASGECRMVTDYPDSGSAILRIGGRRYFESTISCDEAASNLRVAGAEASRNSYVPMDGTLRLAANSTRPNDRSARTLGTLGEWCFFTC